MGMNCDNLNLSWIKLTRGVLLWGSNKLSVFGNKVGEKIVKYNRNKAVLHEKLILLHRNNEEIRKLYSSQY
jgi:hypothetical protein